MKRLQMIMTRNTFKTYIRHSLLLSISLFIIFGFTEYNKNVTLVSSYKSNIEKIYTNDGVDISLFCYTSNCKRISINDTLFEPNPTTGVLSKINNEVLYSTEPTVFEKILEKIFNSTFTIELSNEDKLVVWLGTHNYQTVLSQFYIMNIFFLIWYGVIYFRNARNEAAASLLAKKNIKTVLEGKLQYTVAGSMHHEMLGPITVIKDLFDEIREAMLIYYVDDCGDCPIKKQRRKTDIHIPRRTIIDYIEKISSSIDRLHGVLALLRESKDNRYSNGNKNIATLTSNLFATTSIFTSRHFEYVIKNEELLKTLHLKKLPNGEFMNILSNLVTNSVEAKCSKVILECKLVTPGLLQMFCIDNGTGVLGKDGKIIKASEYDLIFAYGVSSKDLSGNVVYDKRTWLSNLVRTIFYKPELFTSESGRGLGMYVIRETLKKYDGEISLHKTSTNGTIFKLLIPVEPFKHNKG